MWKTSAYILVISISSCLLDVYCQSKVSTNDDGTAGTIKFTTPDLNDEESHSAFMPNLLRCDACKAVAYQLSTRFDSFNEKHKYLKNNIPESEVIEIFEDTCSNVKTFDSYGLKSIKGIQQISGPGLTGFDIPGVTAAGGRWPRSYGLKTVGDVNRLSGPGTDAADSPGIMAGGGKWPGRLMDMCEQYMGEIGEMEIYKAYKKHPKNVAEFQKYLCHGSGIRNDCLKSKVKAKKSSKKEEL